MFRIIFALIDKPPCADQTPRGDSPPNPIRVIRGDVNLSRFAGVSEAGARRRNPDPAKREKDHKDHIELIRRFAPNPIRVIRGDVNCRG